MHKNIFTDCGWLVLVQHRPPGTQYHTCLIPASGNLLSIVKTRAHITLQTNGASYKKVSGSPLIMVYASNWCCISIAFSTLLKVKIITHQSRVQSIVWSPWSRVCSLMNKYSWCLALFEFVYFMLFFCFVF